MKPFPNPIKEFSPPARDKGKGSAPFRLEVHQAIFYFGTNLATLEKVRMDVLTGAVGRQTLGC